MSTASDERDVAELGRMVADMLLHTTRPNHIWKPLPHQVPPPGDWRGWLLLAGRGAGKTAACSQYVIDHVKGPPCLPGAVPHWIGIIAPTLGDAATSCFAGPAGIHTRDPAAQLRQRPGGLLVEWPNGAQAKLFGTRDPDDVERLRAGGNLCLAWLEEVAAWRYMQEAFDQMRFGLRVGAHPRWIGSTTPKPRPLIKALFTGKYRNVVVTHATMYDNPHLPGEIREDLEDSYAGTTLGQQELLGRLVEQDALALWTRETITRTRLTAPPDDMRRVEVGVDPSGGQGEQGIIVVGSAQRLETPPPPIRAVDPLASVITDLPAPIPEAKAPRMLKHGYVLADYTVRGQPDEWGRRAVDAAVDWEADCIVVEINFGGEMAQSTIITAADHLGVSVPVKVAHASRGKAPRAQPVGAMGVQGRWHNVGTFEELEDQQCTWHPGLDWSPDRLDGMVWPAWHMKLVSTSLRAVGTFGGGAMVRRALTRRRPA